MLIYCMCLMFSFSNSTYLYYCQTSKCYSHQKQGYQHLNTFLYLCSAHRLVIQVFISMYFGPQCSKLCHDYSIMFLIILSSFCLSQVITIYNCLYNSYFYQTESLCPLKYLTCLKRLALPYNHMLASCNRSGTIINDLLKDNVIFTRYTGLFFLILSCYHLYSSKQPINF